LKELTKKLDNLGAQGYELVGVFDGFGINESIIVFKRPDGYLEV
jgi:hypothetical protein